MVQNSNDRQPQHNTATVSRLGRLLSSSSARLARRSQIRRKALLAELHLNRTWQGIVWNAARKDALAGGRGEPLRGRRDVNRWLLDTLRPASCDSAHIMVLPAWHAGVGSSLLMFARLAMLGIEHGYTIVPLGWREDHPREHFQLWKFATGLDPPTHEFFLEPLSSCGVEARRRRANTTVWSQYDRVNIFELLRRLVLGCQRGGGVKNTSLEREDTMLWCRRMCGGREAKSRLDLRNPQRISLQTTIETEKNVDRGGPSHHVVAHGRHSTDGENDTIS